MNKCSMVILTIFSYSYDFHQKMSGINITKFTNLLKLTLLIYHTVWTVSNLLEKIVEIREKHILLTHQYMTANTPVHDCSLFLLSTDTSIKSGGFKLVFTLIKVETGKI